MIPIKLIPGTASGKVATVVSSGLQALPPLSLYIHIPWCLKKCPYCDFNSHESPGGTAEIPEAEYLRALEADLDAALPQVWGRKVVSVFIGGGTPSLLSAAGLDHLLVLVRARLPLLADAEITLEANPGTFEIERFREYRKSGVTRLSVGIQSFDAQHLLALGRVHDADEAKRAAEIAATTFETFNLDLMFALPGQTVTQLQADVQTALSFAPPHISLYHLTIEPNTVFAKYPPVIPDDDTAADLQDALEGMLGSAGYEHYETSAHAKRGHRCRHNENYWRFGDYLGIGAGAHSKLSFHDRIIRQARYKQPVQYMRAALAGDALVEDRVLSQADLPFEFMMNVLRLTDGVAVAEFAERTGLPLTVITRQLDTAESRGLLVRDHKTMRATAAGALFLNDLLQLFLPK